MTRNLKPLQLVGCEHSYFTAKARAYLLWSGLPFKEVQSTNDVYRQIILPKVGWPVIPILIDENNTSAVVYIQDTSDIIDYCEFTYSDFINKKSLPPISCVKQRIASFCLEALADLWLMIPAMHYRWNYPENRHFITHEWVRAMDPLVKPTDFDDACKRASKSMSKFANSLPILGVNDELLPAIENDYLHFLKLLENHFKLHSYILGDRPSFADFALMGPLYAHLFRDPVPGFIMKTKAPMTAEWVDRVNKRTCHVQKAFQNNGGLLEDDAIPETLWEILNYWARNHIPILASTVKLTRDMINGEEGVELPRAAGMHDFKIDGKVGQRAAFTYDVWMLQRICDEMDLLRNAGSTNEVSQFCGRLEHGDVLLNMDLEGVRMHRKRGTRSIHGNNLFSGNSPTPDWVGGASKVSLSPTSLKNRL